MAQVTQAVSQDIEKLLDLLAWQWERLPEVESEIDTWDLMERLNFIEEWPLEEDRLMQLKRYVDDGLLNLSQRNRFAAIEQTIARNRPIIRRLQNS